MIYRICTFTDRGAELAKRLELLMYEHVFEIRDGDMPLSQWAEETFTGRLPLVFIGACGIAVRTIAPFVRDKLTDSPVIVIDESAKFVIPLLSGHIGGANRIAQDIAGRLGAEAVITTATDVNGTFAADVFAQENGLEIINRDAIRFVSGKLLRYGQVNIAWSDEIAADENTMPKCLRRTNEDEADIIITARAVCADKDVLVLRPKQYAVGIGCKKDSTEESIRSAVNKAMEKIPAASNDIFGIASIDLKAKEKGIIRYAAAHKIPFYTYSAQILAAVEGSISRSEFVENITGVDNVCERAALCLAGKDAELILTKQAAEGVTVAAAKRKAEITTWLN